MNNKILVAVHNYRDNDDRLKTLIDEIVNSAKSVGQLMIASKHKRSKFNITDDVLHLDISDTTIAQSYNRILNYSYDNNYEYTIIIDDDIIIKTSSQFSAVLQNYISLLKTYNLPMISYGYGSVINRVFGKPSPVLAITNNDMSRDEMIFNRWPNSTIMVIDNSVRELFNEKMKYMYFKDFVSRLNKRNDKRIPFIGFFMDLPYAYEVFDRDMTIPTQRTINAKELLEEKNSMQIDWQVHNNMDDVFIWLSESKCQLLTH